MSYTFDGVMIEDLQICPNENLGSGITTTLLYAPASFFRMINLPKDSSVYAENSSIKKDDIEFLGGCGWCAINILIDENELKTFITGAKQRKRTKSELDFYTLGFRENNLGFVEKHKNTPFVFGIVDTNGTHWILGNLRNRAFIENADSTTNKKYEDNSGTVFKISANTSIYKYEGDFRYILQSRAFSKGFSLGFNS